MEFTLYYHNQAGERDSTYFDDLKYTTPDIIDYVLVAEDFKFPCSNYGLEEETPQIQLKVATAVGERQLLREVYTRTMYIAYILLVPHGMSLTDEQNFYYSPHGDGIAYYMSKCNSTNLQEEQ